MLNRSFVLTPMLLFVMMVPGMSRAGDGGDLDPSFDSDGWIEFGQGGYFNVASDVAVDSQGRYVVVGAGEIDVAGGGRKMVPKIWRFTDSGDPDTTFNFDGVLELGIPVFSGTETGIRLALGSSDDIYFGYTRAVCDGTCPPDPETADVLVYHLDATGAVVGTRDIAFDLGGSDDRIDDIFADIALLVDGRLAVAATVERVSAIDTDFGVAVLTVNGAGQVYLDATFGTDGKTTCMFDHGGGLGNQDSATAIAGANDGLSVYVGGTAFEGNGINLDGTNMALCRLSPAGAETGTWSTFSSGAMFESREELADLVVLGDGKILVGGMRGGDGGLDFSVARLNMDLSDDLAFGDNPLTNHAEVGFAYPFVGATNDKVKEILVDHLGGIMVGGTISNSGGNLYGAVALSRFTAEGVLDIEWGIGGGGGKAIYSFHSALEDTFGGLAKQTDGKILIAGATVDGSQHGYLARVLGAQQLSDLIFADGFESGGTARWSEYTP